MSLPEVSLLWVSTHWSEMMVRKKPQWNSKRGRIATLTDCLYHREDACNGLCMKVGEWWKIPELEDSGSSYSLQKVNGNILCFALCFFFYVFICFVVFIPSWSSKLKIPTNWVHCVWAFPFYQWDRTSFHFFYLSIFFSKKHAFSPSVIRKYESRPSTKSLIHYTENEQPNFNEHQKKKKGGRRTPKEKKLKKNIEK